MSNITRAKLSYYDNVFCQNSKRKSLGNVLIDQKIETYKEIIGYIRQTDKKSTRDELKKSLPAITFGGLFNGRTSLIEPSGLACLDFDKVKNIKSHREQLANSKFVLSIWLSPSGKGLKVLVRIPLVKNKDEYKEYYKALLEHFEHLNPDFSTSDINRLCFVSYDPDLYTNKHALIFTEKVKPKTILTAQSEILNPACEGATVDRLLKWWRKNYSFAPGYRNTSLYVLACSFSNFGVKKSTSEYLLKSFESSDFKFCEIQKIIDSAYRRADYNIKSFAK